jgi:hypothetical protein
MHSHRQGDGTKICVEESEETLQAVADHVFAWVQPDGGTIVLRLPTLTISATLTLHCGDIHVRLLHPGYPAYTLGDLVASCARWTGSLSLNLSMLSPVMARLSTRGRWIRY